MSSVDSFRVWSVQPGNPQSAFFQDVSVGSPIVAPSFFYPSPSILTGETVATPPQLRVYFGRSAETPAEAFFGNAPVAPRVLRPLIGGAGFPLYIDIIVYFRDPPAIPVSRAPMTNAFLLLGQPLSTQYINGELSVPDNTIAATLWQVPGYGRRRVNFTLETDNDITYTFRGRRFCGTTSPYTSSRVIHTATVTSAAVEAQVLNTASFDYYDMSIANASGNAALVEFSFELTDN
jgi:hypothetical protein